MAHDYANRSKPRKPAARRKSSAARNTPKPRSKKKVIGVSLVALLILTGFGYVLYQLALVEPDPAVTQQTVEQQSTQANRPLATNSTAHKTSKDQRDGSRNEYKFYQLLPESEVVPPQVDAYKSTPKSVKNYSQYLLQAGSFRGSADADSLRAKLILAGLPNVTMQKVASAKGTVWYRVRVGPFESRSKLNKAQDKMVRMNLQPLQINVSQ